MSPRKQPKSLFTICVKSCITLINSTCYVICEGYPNNEFHECEKRASLVKGYLMSILPARLFDVLCSYRKCRQYNSDPRIQLYILSHPNMAVFRKCDLDNMIPQQFWISSLPKFQKLVVLDLKFICTDDILKVIGVNCLLLEEINIVSRVDICKSPFNASVFIRNVSDCGLSFVANLKQLRILAMDPPRNERASRIGRCVSQAGIITLVNELPNLEELSIESCDIGSTLIGSDMEVGPFNLRKINCHFASANSIKKLVKVCPFVKELSVTHLSEQNKDGILDEITGSELRLNKLDLLFFSYTQSMHQLLILKGNYLTHFSLWEIENSMNLDSIIAIGKCCPHLNYLCLMTQSKYLVVPSYFKRNNGMFTELRALTLGYENFHIDHLLTFFFDCSQKVQKLVLKYQSVANVDNILMRLLERGSLSNIEFMWLDCTLAVSKNVIKRIIEACNNLRTVTVDVTDDMSDVQTYIQENNLDIKFGSY